MGQRVPRVKTEVSESQLAQALIEAWKSLFGNMPSKEQIAMLLSQNALETGHRKSMWNYNVGNITTDGNGKYDYWEGLDWLYESLPSDQTGLSPRQKKTITLKYRAYPNLIEGAKDYLQVISSGRYSKAWQNILHPNIEEYSKALKDAGYYTADEAPYTKNLVSLFSQFNKSNGYEKAKSGDVSEPQMLAVKDINSDSKKRIDLMDKINKWLEQMGSLASLSESNVFLIKVGSDNFTDGIEYSRILCDLLKSRLNAYAYTHVEKNNIDIECSTHGNPFQDLKNIKSLCNELSSKFVYLSKNKNLNINTTPYLNKRSTYKKINLKTSTMNYRKFLINNLMS